MDKLTPPKIQELEATQLESSASRTTTVKEARPEAKQQVAAALHRAMANKPSTRNEEFENFEVLTRKLAQVPKSDLDAKRSED